MTATTISRSVEFDAGHRVPEHGGKCRSPHGHRYRVVATIAGAVGHDGMVLDFGELADLLDRLVHEPYDHAFLVDRDDKVMRQALDADPTWKVAVLRAAPTAENLAALIADALAWSLPDELQLVSVSVDETPKCRAVWRP
jgi:6-pyruvoyltetrahydropterin/6-carboxytetrahydropterin synthase